MSFRVALFDLDGTVLDTLDDLTTAVNHALSGEGFPTHDREAVRSFIGNGVAKLIERAVPQGTDKGTVSRVFSAFKTYYANHCSVQTKPYDGILSLLATLRANGVRTALISNKADFAVQTLVKDYFDGLFDTALGEVDDLPRKPAPDMVYHVLEKLNANAKDAVFIGDSDVDIKTAQNAGLASIAVTWGFREEACLRAAGATCFAHTPSQLQSLIL